MKLVQLLAGVMLLIIITGCNQSNPTLQAPQKNFELDGVKVRTFEYRDKTGKLQEVACQWDIPGATRGVKIAFEGDGTPKLYGAVMYDLSDLKMIVKLMSKYEPTSTK